MRCSRPPLTDPDSELSVNFQATTRHRPQAMAWDWTSTPHRKQATPEPRTRIRVPELPKLTAWFLERFKGQVGGHTGGLRLPLLLPPPVSPCKRRLFCCELGVRTCRGHLFPVFGSVSRYTWPSVFHLCGFWDLSICFGLKLICWPAWVAGVACLILAGYDF